MQLSYGKGRPYMDAGHRMARFGDSNVTYQYKGKEKPVHPWPTALDEARLLITEDLKWVPNCVVVNSYSPSSSLYPHSDSKYIPQLGRRPMIASVSLGESRIFRLSPVGADGKRVRGADVDVVLEHGDLLVMHDDCDEKYHHSIPAELDKKHTRISLTFRRHLL